MSVTDLASYRRDDRARHLALWREFSGVYVQNGIMHKSGTVDHRMFHGSRWLNLIPLILSVAEERLGNGRRRNRNDRNR